MISQVVVGPPESESTQCRDLVVDFLLPLVADEHIARIAFGQIARRVTSRSLHYRRAVAIEVCGLRELRRVTDERLVELWIRQVCRRTLHIAPVTNTKSARR